MHTKLVLTVSLLAIGSSFDAFGMNLLHQELMNTLNQFNSPFKTPSSINAPIDTSLIKTKRKSPPIFYSLTLEVNNNSKEDIEVKQGKLPLVDFSPSRSRKEYDIKLLPTELRKKPKKSDFAAYTTHIEQTPN